MEELCSVCGEPVQDFSDWVLHEPLCLQCWIESQREDVGD